MSTADELKARTDLLGLLERYVPLRRVASTNGGEWAGPCPFCGGRDRFIVWPEKGRYWCRRCNRRGDAIQYLRDRHGMGFKEACQALVTDQVKMESRSRHPAVPRAKDARDPSPPGWVADGFGIIESCQAELGGPSATQAREWLRGRGLTDGTIKTFKLGYNPCDREINGLWVYGGILIPGIAVDGQLYYLKVSRPGRVPKYKDVSGSRAAMVGVLAMRNDLLVTEGEFDMMLAWQEAGDLVDVATFGGTTSGPLRPWRHYLLAYERILLAQDVDTAGEEEAEKWKWMARAQRLVLPFASCEGKDITDFLGAGGNLRTLLGTIHNLNARIADA